MRTSNNAVATLGICCVIPHMIIQQKLEDRKRLRITSPVKSRKVNKVVETNHLLVN